MKTGKVQKSTWPKTHYQKWEHFEQSLKMKTDSGEEKLEQLQGLKDLQSTCPDVTGHALARAPNAFPLLNAMQAVRINQVLNACVAGSQPPKKSVLPAKTSKHDELPPAKRRKSGAVEPLSAQHASPWAADPRLPTNGHANVHVPPVRIAEPASVQKLPANIQRQAAAVATKQAPTPPAANSMATAQSSPPVTTSQPKPSDRSGTAAEPPGSVQPKQPLQVQQRAYMDKLLDMPLEPGKYQTAKPPKVTQPSPKLYQTPTFKSPPSAPSLPTSAQRPSPPEQKSTKSTLTPPVQKSLAPKQVSVQKLAPAPAQRPAAISSPIAVPIQKPNSAQAPSQKQAPAATSVQKAAPASAPAQKTPVAQSFIQESSPMIRQAALALASAVQAAQPDVRQLPVQPVPAPATLPTQSKTAPTTLPAQSKTVQTSLPAHSQPVPATLLVQSSPAPVTLPAHSQPVPATLLVQSNPAPVTLPARSVQPLPGNVQQQAALLAPASAAQAPKTTQQPVRAEQKGQEKPAEPGMLSLAKLMDAPGLVKHACDCIDSLAGLLQVLNLVMNSGVQMPKDLRKTLDMTLDLSLAQIKQQMNQPPPGPSGS